MENTYFPPKFVNSKTAGESASLKNAKSEGSQDEIGIDF
jgi:hypothetical protein